MRKELLIGGISMTLATMALAVPTSATDTTDAVDSVSIGVPISCSIEGTGMNSHTASVPNGTYQADIGTTTLKAYCNDDEGFAIFAAGYTGDEIGGTNSTKLVGTNGNIVTGTATSGSTSNWAMKLATNSGATYPITLDNSFSSYSAVPASYTKVAHRDSGTDIGTGATGASLTTTYAAFVSQTQPAGTYSGKVIYTLVHPSNEAPIQPIACEGGKICYNPNTATASGEMRKQSASNNASIGLWASNFKRAGYGFAGWNTAYDYSGTTYGPQQTITTPSNTSTKGLSLYAVWIKSAGKLQNWSGCSSLTQGATTALTDERDGNTYAVAKLADGKCWTIENLRLADKDSNNNDIELSSANTHNPSTPLTITWWFSTDNDSDTKPTSNHLSATTDPTSNTWCNDFSSNCMDQSMLATNNTISGTYSHGNYYNWYSATAGHGKYGNSYGSGYDAPGDICPTGWHLPTGSSSGEYYVLNTAVNNGATGSTASNNLRSYPNNFVYSGSVSGSSISDLNSWGYYWSTSGGGSGRADRMSLSGTGVTPATRDGSFKSVGHTVRCIAGV